MTHARRALAALALAGLLAAPLLPAAAQELAPYGIGAYSNSYVVYGRVVNAKGYPVAGIPFSVSVKDTLDGTENVGGPITGQTHSRGDIEADFRMGQVTQFGVVVLEVGGERFEKKLDPELRRTDFNVTLRQGDSPPSPPAEWARLYSVRVRAVNLTDPYPSPEWGSLYAKPLVGARVDATLITKDGGGSRFNFRATEAQGDWNYTFTDLPENLTGAYLLLQVGGRTYNITDLDLMTRYTFVGAKFGESRVPASYGKETPEPLWITPFALAAAALVGVWWYARHRRGGAPPDS